MSTPEQPTPPTTRKQLRDLRNTAATPIITPTDAPEEPPVVAAPLPRPAEAAPVPAAPVPDTSVDLGSLPLTRRQARQQERIRTASVPVITPEMLREQAAQAEEAREAERAELAATEASDQDEATDAETTPDRAADDEVEVDLIALPASDAAVVQDTDAAPDAGTGTGEADSAGAEASDISEVQEATIEPADAWAPVTAATVPDADADAASHEPILRPSAVDEEVERPIVSSALGSELLAGDVAAADLPPSFDQLLARGSSSTGSLATPNALILSQSPDSGPLVGPVTATGEVLITGTFALPEGLGSNGHAPGMADGKDVDAVLVDGELPAASSPTPIAASAAVSTVKGAQEIIRPPAPEKGNKLMMTLAITAGALALALVGVLIIAFATGVFQ
jgi:hypothetical protein